MSKATDDAVRFVQDTIRATLEKSFVMSDTERRRALAKHVGEFIDGLKAMPVRSEARVYAADIRQMGATLDERIPDCAWVPASAVRFECEAEANGESNELRMCVTFEKPFQWVEVPITIVPNGPGK